MSDKKEVLKTVRAAFEIEPRINLHSFPIQMDFSESDGTLTLEGEMENIAAKKLALELAVAVPGVKGILDRTTVVPAAPMTDAEIRDHLRDALIEEPAFSDCRIRSPRETFRTPAEQTIGDIEISVEGNAVLLEGTVPSLSHKRLAGVLAWWVPGSANVLNCLEVSPSEEDSDDEIIDALKLTLEKDPFINADQISVSARNGVVTLEGLLPNEMEKEMAEFDAWFVFGVDKVINKIEVQA
jgi:osmotically-inducible protein OsmY